MCCPFRKAHCLLAQKNDGGLGSRHFKERRVFLINIGFVGSLAKTTYMVMKTLLWLWMGVSICLKNPKQRKMRNIATFSWHRQKLAVDTGGPMQTGQLDMDRNQKAWECLGIILDCSTLNTAKRKGTSIREASGNRQQDLEKDLTVRALTIQPMRKIGV